MQNEILNYISEQNLSPFMEEKRALKAEKSVYQTSQAKAIHNKVINHISKNFNFKDTESIFQMFGFTLEPAEIEKRQKFFSEIKPADYSFLKNLKKKRERWHPSYGILVVTTDESTFLELKNLDCPVKLIISENDISSLEGYDLIQAIDFEEYRQFFEQLPNVVFLHSIDEVYLERYLVQLAEWKDIIEIMKNSDIPDEMKCSASELAQLFYLLEDQKAQNITRERIEDALAEINSSLSSSLKNMTLSGDALIGLMSRGSLPAEISRMINKSIAETNLPEMIFTKSFPISIDEDEVNKIMKKQDSYRFTKKVEAVSGNSKSVRNIPANIRKISNYIVFLDFISGVLKYIQAGMSFPRVSSEMSINQSVNILIENAQPISFSLDRNKRCSILTGANSGGKTTLLEHIIQLNSIFQIGLPLGGTISLPLFSEIYYFAKNKGSVNKGAFETLLGQMSTIKPGSHTLILADEIESVTEPGVAGMIISATADYFLKNNCFLVIATHLGHEIKNILPEYARIDGIEAKGLDEQFNLIVDHNPVLGRLANSTPELIVERMAKSKKNDYFSYLYSYLNNHKK